MTPDQVSAVRARVEQALRDCEEDILAACARSGELAQQRADEKDYGVASRAQAEAFGYSFAALRIKRMREQVEAACRAVPLSAEPEGLRDKIADAWWAGRQSVRQWSVESASGPQLIAACDDLINKLLAAPTVAQAPQPKPEDR
jgi:hypothetical protein